MRLCLVSANVKHRIGARSDRRKARGLELRLELHKDQTSEERETHARKGTYKKGLREVPFVILFYL